MQYGTPLRRDSLTDQVREAILRKIVEGDLGPGDRLAEIALAEEFGVSRTPVREALQQLTGRGLLVKEGARTTVAQLSHGQLYQLYEVRETLESTAARLFARRATEAQRSALRETHRLVQQARREGDAAGVRRHDFDLHRGLIDGANNEYLSGPGDAEAFLVLALLLRDQQRVRDLPPTPPGEPLPDPHAAVMAAVEARDPEAAEAAMYAHVHGSHDSLLAALDSVERQRLYPACEPKSGVTSMSQAQMTGRERLLAAVRHEEPDRVPICPRIQFSWLDPDGSHRLEQLYTPAIDPMEILSPRTPNYIISYPEQYDLPEVRVEQKRYEEGEYQVVERTFHTPAGKLSDRTKIPPSGREYGMSPNPIKTEYLVKSRADVPALRYVLPEIKGDYDHIPARMQELGERGVVMVNILSELCHQAGDVRDMQDLMMDYYLDRPLFDELLELFHERTMAETRGVLEAGGEWIFSNCYYNSVSAGWSPAIFAEVFVPHIRQQAELAHSYGAYVDYYDDGKLAHSMELIADCGVDVLETCTPPPMCDFDLAEAKAKIGAKTALKGYVDLLYVVMRGTPELVERTVAEAMEIGKPGGGFIIGSSDSFREGTPPENMHAYFQACLKYGVYG